MYRMQVCLLAFFIIGSVSAQRWADTVTIYDDIKIRIIRNADTVIMSDRQFRSIVDIAKSFNESISICYKQHDLLYEQINICDSVVSKKDQYISVLDASNKFIKSEYDNMMKIAMDQNVLLNDINLESRKDKNRRTWSGVLYGSLGGLFVGTFLTFLILR